MKIIGTVESLWRYPVKGMRGEKLPEAFMGFSGFYGDRCYAIKDAAARKGFPYLNGNVQPEMLRCQPQFRYFEKSLKPPNLEEASSLAPGVNPTVPDANDFDLDVIFTESGKTFSIADPLLLEMLGAGLRGEHHLSIARSDRALTDCRPVSLISRQTISQIETESGISLDKRRFRMNIYFDLNSEKGFGEDAFIGRRLRIGDKAEIMVLERDPRCKAISLDPETGEHNPQILKSVAQLHEANAGVYCAVLVEGVLKAGDSIGILE
jgi:uncharacterized protein YcbX